MKIIVKSLNQTKEGNSKVRCSLREILAEKNYKDADFREVYKGEFQSKFFEQIDLADSQKAIAIADDIKEGFFLLGLNKRDAEISIKF